MFLYTLVLGLSDPSISVLCASVTSDRCGIGCGICRQVGGRATRGYDGQVLFVHLCDQSISVPGASVTSGRCGTVSGACMGGWAKGGQE